MKDTGIQLLLGKTFTDIIQSEDELIFVVSEEEKYKMYHAQDCCESVAIDDICGDISDLLGSPILLAEEVNNETFVEEFRSRFNVESEWGGMKDKNGNHEPESYTWTFYKLATINGYVDIRWYGESNGYYSESVDVVEVGSVNDWS